MPALIEAKKPTAVKKAKDALYALLPAQPPPPKPPTGMLPAPERDMSKYAFLKPEAVKFVPRDDFIQSVCGMLPPLEVDVAAYVLQHYMCSNLTCVPKDLQSNLYYVASYYKDLTNRGARLPKFSRWVTSLYPNEKRYVEVFSAIGQKVKPITVIVSDKCEDILRAADSKFFASCFKGSKTLKDIAEQVPGMGVIFGDDAESGQMQLRMWLLHVKTKDGKDGLGLGRMYGAQADSKAIAESLSKANNNCPVFLMSNNGTAGDDVEAVNGFKTSLYFDFNCWGKSKAVRLAG